MGIDYSTGAMFGAFAKKGTEAEEKLAQMVVDSLEADGDSAVALPNGAVVCRTGNAWSGEYFYSIRVGASHSFTSRGGGYSGPFSPPEDGASKINDAIAVLGLSPAEFTGVGHYLTLDVF